MAIIVNLFGEGIRYWICDIPTDKFQKMEQLRTEQNEEWEQSLYDLSFLKKFGYLHWSELASRGEFKLFLLNKKNRIELKKKSKLLERIITLDLDNVQTVFPLYETEVIENLTIPKIEGCVSLILAQYETGLFAKYQINDDNLLFSDLRFNIIQQIEGNDINALQSMLYKEKHMKEIGEDSLVRSCKVWFI